MRSLFDAMRVDLIPRYVDHLDKGEWHICMARPDLYHNGIVTLQALCSTWCFGTLSHYGHGVLAYLQPDDAFCAACETAFRPRRNDLDPHHRFRWRAPNAR